MCSASNRRVLNPSLSPGFCFGNPVRTMALMTDGSIKHADDKGDQILVDDNYNITGIIDWD